MPDNPSLQEIAFAQKRMKLQSILAPYFVKRVESSEFQNCEIGGRPGDRRRQASTGEHDQGPVSTQKSPPDTLVRPRFYFRMSAGKAQFFLCVLDCEATPSKIFFGVIPLHIDDVPKFFIAIETRSNRFMKCCSQATSTSSTGGGGKDSCSTKYHVKCPSRNAPSQIEFSPKWWALRR
jgi:hypothetical protein